MWGQSPRYIPFASGKYEVAPGLRAFGADLGNGAQDQCVFQLDQNFLIYRATKIQARAENLEKYFPPAWNLPEASKHRVVHFIVEKLLQENPQLFRLEEKNELRYFYAASTQEILTFDRNWSLVVEASTFHYHPPPRCALDALALQVQEDFSLWRSEGDKEWLATIHLCFPNHWAAADKIGRSFLEVHDPVAGFARMAPTAPSLVKAMIEKGPFVRFAWGISTDNRLNHHPLPPPEIPATEWLGRAFDPENPQVFVRLERQTLQPFPEQRLSLFTIRTFFLNAAELDESKGERSALRAAIQSMSPESLAYKGLTQSRDAILDWLRF